MPPDLESRAAAVAAIAALQKWLAATEPPPDLPEILTLETGGHLTTEAADLLLME